MGSRLQKIGLSLVVMFCLAYGVYYVYGTGRFDTNLLALKQMVTPVFTPTPTPSFSATPKPRVSVTAKPTIRMTVAPSPAQANPELTALLSAVNERRINNGLVTLGTSSLLQRLAQQHADDMVAHNYFDHTSPDGVTFQQRITAGDYTGAAAGENLGLTSGTTVSVVASWMDSPPHKANILGSPYRYVGFGIAHGTYQGMAVVFVVAIFGDQ